MLHILNSAMMPIDGIYERKTITAQQFKQIFLRYKDNYKSSVGYPNACRVISELVGLNIPLSRDMTELKQGDIIIVAKLRYRVNPSEKSGRKHGEWLEDYEFCQVTFTALE